MAEAEGSAVYQLLVENELRIVAREFSGGFSLVLLDGQAEIYGSEMVQLQVYAFPLTTTSISVYTWHGCRIEVVGSVESATVVPNSPMILNVVLHASLEERRIIAESDNTRGPVTLVVGPTDVGKSTLCRMLLNYACRMGRRPLFIDLDVGQNSISIPGTIGVLTVEKPAHIVDGFDDRTVQVYHFGHKNPGRSILQYFLLLKKLGNVLQSGLRSSSSSNMRSSGVIINSCGWVRGFGYDALTLAAMTFEIDVLCVLEDERLFAQLEKDMPHCVKVLFVPKMSGIAERSRLLRMTSRNARIREYFYGPANQLHPFSFDVNYSDIKVFKVTSRTPSLDESLDSVSFSDVTLEPVPFGIMLANQVLGLSFADNISNDVIVTNVIGFVCVTHVDTSRTTIRVLSPQPSPLPRKILLMGDNKITDL